MEGDGGRLLVPVAPGQQACEHDVRRGQLLQDGLHHCHVAQPHLCAHRLQILELQGPHGQGVLTNMPQALTNSKKRFQGACMTQCCMCSRRSEWSLRSRFARSFTYIGD